MKLLTDDIARELRKTHILQIENILEDFDKQLAVVQEQMRRLSYDLTFDSLELSSKSGFSYSRTKMINTLARRIQNLADSNELIETIRIYLPSIERTLQSIPYESYIINVEGSNELLNRLPKDKETDIHIVYTDTIHFVTVDYILVDDYPKPVYIIDVTLSDTVITNKLIDISSAIGGESVLFHLDGEFRYQSSATSVGQEIDKAISSVFSLGDVSPHSVTATVYGEDILYMGRLNYLDAYFGASYDSFLLKGILKKYNVRLIAFSVISILFSLYVWGLTYALISNSLKELASGFNRLAEGDMNVQINHRRNDEFSFIFIHFNAMVKKLKNLIENDYQQRILKQKAEIRQLQYQINPHFLYNSLFQIKLMADAGDYENIERFTNHLSEYYRYITRADYNQIPLKMEVEHMRNYIEMQNFRFMGRINVIMGELPESAYMFMVPRLIMQPIVENAFEHGLKNVMEGGLIRISFNYKAPLFEAVFEDNGAFIPQENIELLQAYIDRDEDINSIELCTGIFNVSKRLRFVFGEGSGLIVSKGTDGGLKVTMRIQFSDVSK